MLTKPLHGWTDFQLDDTSVYSLSYLDDIPFEWLDSAIIGLKNKHPFCVKGCLEPGTFCCRVGLCGCQVETEGEIECSDTDMLTFCKYLLEDIGQNTEDWAAFATRCVYNKSKNSYRVTQLGNKLKQLNDLTATLEKIM